MLKFVYILSFVISLALTMYMSSLATDFLYTDGHPFSIMHLELAKSKADLDALFVQMDSTVITKVKEQLHADYIFMIGCYPFVGILCWIVSGKVNNKIGRQFFRIAACLQVFPFLFDILENMALEKWIDRQPWNLDFSLFRTMVIVKFAIALGMFLICVLTLFYISLSEQLNLKKALH